MILNLTEQEHSYLLQVLLERPVKESLPMVLKLTQQKLAPIGEDGTSNVKPLSVAN